VRAVITGGSGFVASHLVRHLLNNGDEILLINRTATPTDHPRSLTWDITVPASEAIRSRLQKFDPDVIFHLAAVSVRALCGDSQPSSRAMAVNVKGTEHVIDVCLNLTNQPMFVFSSSVYVYGSRRCAIELVGEDATPAPDNGYGKSKLLAEELLHQAADALPWVIARSFQHSGPGQTGSLLIPEWISKLRSGKPTITVGNLNSWMDISDARDVVKAYRMLADRQFSGTTFNVGSGQATCSGDIFNTLQKLLKIQCQVHESQPGTNFLPIANTAQIQNRVGWKTTISIEQMLQDCILSTQPTADR